jgi:hypothetical protein
LGRSERCGVLRFAARYGSSDSLAKGIPGARPPYESRPAIHRSLARVL